MDKIDNFLHEIKDPILIISSAIGLGHHNTALAIKERIGDNRLIYYFRIEELISNPLKIFNFSIFFQSRKFLYKFPFIINIFHYLPIVSLCSYWQEIWFRNINLDLLKYKIQSLGIRTVITTSYKAAFYVSILKHRKEINPILWVCLTHYYMGRAWKFIFREEINNFFVPIKNCPLPYVDKKKCIEVEFPVSKEYYTLTDSPKDYNSILLTGGGWGLGLRIRMVRSLIQKFPNLKLFIVCGENNKLYNKLYKEFSNSPNINIYLNIKSLLPLIRICGCIITRPGAVTISEGFIAKRKVFLLKESILETKRNADYAIYNFNMEYFSIERFTQWYYEIKHH